MHTEDWVSLVSGVLSAVLWCASAFVQWSFGYDNDAELANAAKRSALLNAFAAVFTAISVAAPAIAKLCGHQ